MNLGDSLELAYDGPTTSLSENESSTPRQQNQQDRKAAIDQDHIQTL